MMLLLVAVGGALGSMARYGLVALAARTLPPAFPFGTFAVNAIGSLVFGLVAGAAEARGGAPSELRAFLLVGVLGGFTTFSSYSYDTFALLREGAGALAVINSLGQVAVGLAGIALGYVAGRALSG